MKKGKLLSFPLIVLVSIVLVAGLHYAAQDVAHTQMEDATHTQMEDVAQTQMENVTHTRMEDAVSIRFIYPEFGVDILEFEIDLDGQVLRTFSNPDYEERDPSAENEGWTIIEPLNEEQLTDIRRACEPILLWKDYYENPNVQDGWYWDVTITFRDGSTHKSGGHHAWPENYWQTGEALREAGAAVLLPGQEPDY